MFEDRDGQQQYASPLTSKSRSIATAATIVFVLVVAGYILGIDPPRIEMPTTGISPRQLGPIPQKLLLFSPIHWTTLTRIAH